MSGRTAMRRGAGRLGWLVSLALMAALGPVTPVLALNQNVRRHLRTAPQSVGLDLGGTWENAADVITESAARNIPVPASSGAFTFRWDPDKQEYVRSTDTFGPTFFTERAQTLGQGFWNVGLTVQYLQFDEWDGHQIGAANPGERISESAASIPLRVRPTIIYHVETLNVTYGLLDDLDLNVAIPVATLDFDVSSRALPPNSPPVSNIREGHVALALRDILLRAKYRVFERAGFTGAVGAIVQLPTGNPTYAMGTGDCELGSYVALSRQYFDDRLDSSWNGGFSLDVSNTHLSRAFYSWALDLQLVDRLSVAGSLLGRSEIDGIRAPSSISGPHVTPNGIQSLPYLDLNPDRKDYFDATLGVRLRLYRTLVLSLGVYKSINTAGLRASGWSPLGSLEATF